jgi:hypothetical protein
MLTIELGQPQAPHWRALAAPARLLHLACNVKPDANLAL